MPQRIKASVRRRPSDTRSLPGPTKTTIASSAAATAATSQ